jgi:hypothetical protein
MALVGLKAKVRVRGVLTIVAERVMVKDWGVLGYSIVMDLVL